MIHIDIPVEELTRINKLLYAAPEEINKTRKKALVQAMSLLKEDAIRNTTNYYNIDNSSVNKSIKTSINSKEARLISRGRRLALSKFKITPNSISNGISPAKYAVSIIRGGKLKPMGGNPKAFLQKMPSGHIGLFRRIIGKKNKSNKEAIEEYQGISIQQMLKNNGITNDVKQRVSNELLYILEDEIQKILR